MSNSVILEVNNLTMHYQTKRGAVSAVDGVSFVVSRGESLGIIGESGCGKTSLALTLLRLLPSNANLMNGEILLNGNDLVPLSDQALNKYRWNNISMIFQAAMNSLNPVYTIEKQIIEAMSEHLQHLSKTELKEKVDSLFDLVGLDKSLKFQYPHQYSGGMRQRAVIALALSCDPDLIIADEPTTALDVIVQDSLLKQIRKIQDSLDMAMIYISHDVGVIAEVSDRVGVMYAGKMVELGSVEEIFKNPLHPYTIALMSSFPSIVGEKTELNSIPGEPPDLLSPPTGCRFYPRCSFRSDICAEQEPELIDHGTGQFAACWHPGGTE